MAKDEDDKILSLPTRNRLRKLVKAVEAEKAKIAKSRDRLRELASEIEGINESVEEGLEDIDRGLDALSRYL